jgi:hypothetical protein
VVDFQQIHRKAFEEALALNMADSDDTAEWDRDACSAAVNASVSSLRTGSAQFANCHRGATP